ncbi:MAG: hydrogenase maturation protease [Leifsonia sp.]
MSTALNAALPAGNETPVVPARILVAGVGNIFLLDDGFGPEVARRLLAERNSALEGVRVTDYGIRGMHLAYDLLDGVDALILVDAVPASDAAASAPGSIRILHVRPQDLPTGSGGAADPHGMDPAAMLATVRALGGELPDLYVIGCVPQDISEGIGLSEAVQGAVPNAAAAVVALVASLVAERMKAHGFPARNPEQPEE